MRVISGTARGHKLQTADGLDTRPTTDRIKESLFNIISQDLYKCKFLDLFSGSGAIGIEALSRGAEKAVFVEKDKICIDIIKKNLEFTKLKPLSVILKDNAVSAIETLAAQSYVFDIIFMDPPYKSGLSLLSLEAIVKNKILNKDGYIIVERSSKIILPEISGLKIKREKSYKTTIMTFLTLEE